MANRYANLVGANKIKDEYNKINIGFDGVQSDVDGITTDTASRGLTSFAPNISNSDLNNLTKTGWYQGGNLANSPNPSNFYYVNHVEGFSTGVGSYQIAVRNTSGDREMYLRVKATSTWLSWVRIIDQTYGDARYMLSSNYETGTWTPAVQFGGASTGITYSDRFGRYTKIGNVLHWECDLILTSKGSATGDATIVGLPFTSNNSRPYANIIGGFARITLPTNVTGIAFYTPNNSTSLFLRQVGNGLGLTGTITEAHFSSDTAIRASGKYTI